MELLERCVEWWLLAVPSLLRYKIQEWLQTLSSWRNDKSCAFGSPAVLLLYYADSTTSVPAKVKGRPPDTVVGPSDPNPRTIKCKPGDGTIMGCCLGNLFPDVDWHRNRWCRNCTQYHSRESRSAPTNVCNRSPWRPAMQRSKSCLLSRVWGRHCLGSAKWSCGNCGRRRGDIHMGNNMLSPLDPCCRDPEPGKKAGRNSEKGAAKAKANQKKPKNQSSKSSIFKNKVRVLPGSNIHNSPTGESAPGMRETISPCDYLRFCDPKREPAL